MRPDETGSTRSSASGVADDRVGRVHTADPRAVTAPPVTAPPCPPLMTVPEAADRLRAVMGTRFHATTLYRLAKTGQAPVEPVRIGHRVFFRRVDIDAYITHLEGAA